MKIPQPLAPLVLIFSSLVNALPQGLDLFGQDSVQKPFDSPVEEFHNVVSQWLDDAKKSILRGKKNLETWYHDGKEYIKQDSLLYELVTHPHFENYDLRITEPKLCDATVKQNSGYFDIAKDKHLFFWFFESRTSPANAPLILWLNGGPGCSSLGGLLFELGPCSIANEGNNVTRNPYSWNTHANIIFLDQPVNVGYSYADDGTTVSTTPVAAKDVYAFLELFLYRFPQYAELPFHIAAESYGGIYAPNIASVIFKANKELKAVPNPKLTHINLASVILGNGITDPYVQVASVPDYACEGPYPLYDDPNGTECQSLRSKVPICQRLIKACYDFNSRFTCLPALAYCNSQLMTPLMQTGKNLYDVRRDCDRAEDKDGPLCYKEIQWVEKWMNEPSHKVALGVNPDITYAMCTASINQAFALNGDGAHNSAILLPELVDSGIRLLVYAGNADIMCNYMGNERWLERLETHLLDEFLAAESLPWITERTGRFAGEVRSAGGYDFGAGNVTFVKVVEAGHMVPFDQPEAAFDLINRWINDIPLSVMKN